MKLKYISIFLAAMLFSGNAFAQIIFEERETSAVSEVTEAEIGKNSSLNPYNTLYGLLPGLSVTQNVEYNANPDLILRGSTSPLILIDGYERSLEYISASEIADIKVLKDGAATAIYGMKGANGVVLITTKRGKAGSKNISINYSHGMEMPVNMPEMADGYTYALARNEALYYDGLAEQYSQAMLNAFRDGSYPDLFANTDWMREVMRDFTHNNQLDVQLRGGGEKVRYFTDISYKNEFGILNDAYTRQERFNSQLRKYDLNLRINLDADITPTTLLKWTMFGSIKERSRPRESTSTVFQRMYNTPSAAFPVKTSSGLWGGDLIWTENPVATFADKGYFKENPRALQADLRIVQDLRFITKGLSAELAVAFDNYAVYKEEGSKEYKYEVNTGTENMDGGFDTLSRIYGPDDVALSVSCWGMTEQYMRANVEGLVKYDRTFGGKHDLDAAAIYRQEYYSYLGRNNTVKRLSFIGQFGYSYADRYMIDAVVNFAGTSRLPKNRYRTYPSVSAAWLVSNEQWMHGAADVLDFLKLRVSWGQNGNDGIPYELDRAYWVSGGGYRYTDGNSNVSGLAESTLPVTYLTLERVNKYNVGLDLRFFKRLSIVLDAYHHRYDNVLTSTSNLYSSVLGATSPQANIGKYDRRGFEIAVEWRDKVGEKFNYYVGANISHANTEVIENGEGFKDYPWMSAKGLPIGQIFGYEAIGYFRDEADIESSPEQTFSAVRPGDIKYRDLNGDNVIDSRDVKAIGKSGSIPEWYGGLNLGFELYGFGVDMVFQGVAGITRQLNTSSVYRALRNNTNVSTWYLEDRIRWTEETKDIADLPRLSTLDNENNYQTSTQWLVDGSFIKLRNVNIYYNLPEKWVKAMRMQQFQIYLRGNNLFSLDHVPYLNCEDLTINYPDMLSMHLGVNITF